MFLNCSCDGKNVNIHDPAWSVGQSVYSLSKIFDEKQDWDTYVESQIHNG